MLDRAVTRAALPIALLFVAAVGATVWEVVARYVLAAPTTWAHALSTALCAIAFSLGGVVAMVRNEHVRIEVVLDRLPARGKLVVGVLSLLAGAVYLGGLGYAAWLQALEAVWRFDWQGRWTPELTPGPPNWPLPALMKLALAVGAVVFLAMVLDRLLRRSTWRAP